MVQNLTGAIAANATETAASHSYDPNITITIIALIIAATTLAITILTLIYRLGQQMGKVENIEKVIAANFNSLDQKYNTKERIQEIELNIKDKADKDYVDKRINDILNDMMKKYIDFEKNLYKESEENLKQREVVAKSFENVVNQIGSDEFLEKIKTKLEKNWNDSVRQQNEYKKWFLEKPDKEESPNQEIPKKP